MAVKIKETKDVKKTTAIERQIDRIIEKDKKFSKARKLVNKLTTVEKTKNQLLRFINIDLPAIEIDNSKYKKIIEDMFEEITSEMIERINKA